MTASQRIQLRRSEIRQRLAELAEISEPTDEQRAELGALETEYRDTEGRLRAALIAEEAEERAAEERHGDGLDAEQRERIELRSRASLGRYLVAALRGAAVTGAEAELAAAAEVDGIPIELFDTGAGTDAEERAATPAPGTVGVNLDTIRPAVFAPSVLPSLGVEMPRVRSGTFASATITTSTTADAVAKGANAPATAAAFAVQTAIPKRVAARLTLRVEDIAAVGQANFESALRQNLAAALSDELDDQGLNGDGSGNDLAGLFHRLADPAGAAPATVADFDDFAAAHAGGIDGLWATELRQVGIVVGPETYRLAAKTFRGTDGEVSAASYATARTGGFRTNKRMPDSAASLQQAILHRLGRPAMRRAVCPHWGRLSVDDIYSGSAAGERSFTLHALVGDVIVVQPDAYAQIQFKVS